MPDETIIVPIEIPESKALSSLDKVGKSAQVTAAKIENQFSRINNPVTSANSALSKTVNVSDQATNSLTNMGRIVQDMPYGFIGFANNITPAVESLQRLSVQSKLTGTSMSTLLLQSLKGGGGLIFGVSILTSALQFATMGLSAFTRGSRGAAQGADEGKREVAGFGKAVEEAGNSFASAATKATSLVAALSGNSLNLKERKKALDELKSVNQEFFGSLKEEDGLIKGLQGAYDGYIQRLKEIGKTKALESQLTKLFDKKLQLELTIDPKFISQTDAGIQRTIGRMKKELQSLGGVVDISKEVFNPNDAAQARRLELAQRIGELERGDKTKVLGGWVGQTVKDINEIDLRIAALSDMMMKDGKFEMKVDNKQPKSAMDELLERMRMFVKEFGDVFEVPDLEESFTNTRAIIEKNALQLADDIANGNLKSKLQAIQLEPLRIRVEPDFTTFEEATKKLIDSFSIKGNATKPKIISGVVPGVSEDVDKRNKEFFNQFQQNIRATADMVSATLTPAFEGMFDAIIKGQEPLKAFFNGIIQSINQVISRLIAAAIQAAVLSSLSGGTSSFGNIFGRLLGFSDGGGLANRVGFAGSSIGGSMSVNVNGVLRGSDIFLSGQAGAVQLGMVR